MQILFPSALMCMHDATRHSSKSNFPDMSIHGKEHVCVPQTRWKQIFKFVAMVKYTHRYRDNSR